MTKQTATKITNRVRAIGIFNAELPNRVTVGNKVFRRTVGESIVNNLGVSNASAWSLYNHAKKAAIATGLVTEFGRQPKATIPVVTAPAEDATVAADPAPVIPKGAKWSVTASDGEVIYFTSRAKARAEANGGKVAKVEA